MHLTDFRKQTTNTSCVLLVRLCGCLADTLVLCTIFGETPIEFRANTETDDYGDNYVERERERNRLCTV